ncbi:hypothetical protein MSAN_00341800 [Mycena sanguinolenta]|uniref:Uncharacterized protein n=1 Tax=Mycena sanguinolenta TaxID=230812 RepID=A0A8H6ZBX8_9AGAR|nr:hypothetical protein MSAN_00341800 [Mycena sanguinolenta]
MSLHDSTSRAESLCTQCATSPGMNVFQPIAVSAVEVCRAAQNLVQENGTHTARMEKLAALIVHEAERAITEMACATLQSPAETIQTLEPLEAKLDEIRRTIEHQPMRSKKSKWFKDYTFDREIGRLKKELKALVNEPLKNTHKFPAAHSSGISYMEFANLTIRTASAVCDASVLNFLKPVVGIAQIISETAQTVKTNRKAALQLASHSSMVMRSIAEHAATIGSAESNNRPLVVLSSVLSDIQLHLTDLQKSRRQRRITSWIMANKEKDRINGFNQRLDKALALFTSTNILSTHTEVREIVAQVHMNTDLLTTVRADLATVLVTVSTSAAPISLSTVEGISQSRAEGEDGWNRGKKLVEGAAHNSFDDVPLIVVRLDYIGKIFISVLSFLIQNRPKSNRAAALQLAVHSSTVTRTISERAATLGLDGFPANTEVLVTPKCSTSSTSRSLAATTMASHPG